MVRKKAETAGAEVSIDAAGNQWARLEGETEEAVAAGSHLDCVSNGGALDGALGAIAGLEVLRRHAEDNAKPKKTIYAVNWADEEGAKSVHFPHSCLMTI